MNDQTYFDDQFDLRDFASALARGWWVIVVFAGLAALAALATTLLSPNKYTAQADVALLNIRSAVVFEPDFTTVPQEAPPFSSGSSERARALMALAQNKSLLFQVQERLRDALGDSSAATARLLGATRVVQMGDLIRFEVTWDDPETAAAIANAWAESYVELANQAFVATGSQTVGEAKAAAQTAFEQYEQAQAELQTFIESSSEARLIRRVDSLGLAIDALEEQRSEILRLIYTSPYTTTVRLTQTMLDEAVAQVEYAARREAEARRQELDQWYERHARLTELTLRLQDLRGQLESPAGGAIAGGDALALILLRSGLADGSDPSDLILQIDPVQLADMSNEDALQAIDAMLIQTDLARVEAEARIKTLANELANPKVGKAITRLDETRLRDLAVTSVQDMLNRAPTFREVMAAQPLDAIDAIQSELDRRRGMAQSELEAVQARRRELTRKRDAAWDLYITLDNKAREVEAQFAAGAPHVRLAIPAQPPLFRDPRNTKVIVLAALLLGALVGAIFALTRERLRGAT